MLLDSATAPLFQSSFWRSLAAESATCRCWCRCTAKSISHTHEIVPCPKHNRLPWVWPEVYSQASISMQVKHWLYEKSRMPLAIRDHQEYMGSTYHDIIQVRWSNKRFRIFCSLDWRPRQISESPFYPLNRRVSHLDISIGLKEVEEKKW
jgi:hypothetical protein